MRDQNNNFKINKKKRYFSLKCQALTKSNREACKNNVNDDALG